jgi:hypothetical protein
MGFHGYSYNKTRFLMILGIAIGFSMWETQSHKPTIWEWRMALGLPHYKAPPNDKLTYKPHYHSQKKLYIYIILYHGISPQTLVHQVVFSTLSPIKPI